MGTIIEATPKISGITGYSNAELVGSNPRTFSSKQTPVATYRELWSTILAGKTWKGALLNRRKNGEFFLDRETIMQCPFRPNRGTQFIALHSEASIELELRLKLSRADVQIHEYAIEIDIAKKQIE